MAPRREDRARFRTTRSPPTLRPLIIAVLLLVTSFVGLSPGGAATLPSAPSAGHVIPATLHASPTSASGSAASSEPSPAVRGAHPVIAPVDGPRFAFWGPTLAPPGAPQPPGPSPSSGPPTRSNCGSTQVAPLPTTFVPLNCFGADEASVQFFSPLAGSGGNVSWNLSLPVDSGATQNQSDLYAAAWVGMVLTSPAAWMHECLLEVQFYPDHSWSKPAVATPGAWAAAVVGWQIDPRTGVEDTCYYSPLYQSGASGQFLGLSQGDSLNVTLQGWPGSAGGEQVSVVDLTSGNSSGLSVYNVTGGFPLDPAYAASAGPAALSWSASGGLPVSFGFAIGRGANPSVPGNGTAGGCSPGPPPASPSDPSTPCPSYDPVSWGNDTLVPWNIGVPVFFNAATRASPNQVGFSSTVGGAASLTERSNGSCTGRAGSSFCSYPWFSFTCSLQSLQFGATDFPAVSVDFGQSAQYSASPSQTAGLVPFYPPTNFSLPGCGSGVGVTVTINATAGAAEFLSHAYGSVAQALQHIPPGLYSLDYLASPGTSFTGWRTTGGVSVAQAGSPSTTLDVASAGSVTAITSPGTLLQTVDFASGSAGAAVEVVPLPPTNNSTAVHIAAGGSANFPRGSYSVQALPPLGDCFRSWAVSGAAGSTLTSLTLPETTLTLAVSASAVSLSATFAACAGLVNVELTAVGNGTVTLNGTSTVFNVTTHNGSADLTVRPGAYALFANPARTWEFAQWTYGPSAMLTNFTNETWVTLEPGAATVTGTFAASILLVDNPAEGGGIALNETGVTENGTTLELTPGSYSFDAVPSGGYSFQRWRSNDALHLWVLRPRSSVSQVIVNSSATLTADFVTKTNNSVSFDVSPAGAGEVRFNVQNLYPSLTVNASVANGSYLLSYYETYGYRFLGWTTSGPVSVGGGFLIVSGTGGTVTAKFALRLFPVTFLALPAGTVSAKINGTAVQSGGSAHLPLGTYAINATVAVGATWVGWITGFPLGGAGAGSVNATVQVTGSGSIAGLAVTFRTPHLDASLATVDVGSTVDFTTFANATGTAHYRYSGLPTGCVPRNLVILACVPTGTGNFSVSVVVTDGTGNSLRSPATLVQVVVGPAISAFTSSSLDFTQGGSTTLTVTGAGGVAPLTYSYPSLPAGCTSASSPSLVCSPTSAGTFHAEAELSDLLGEASFANVTFTVEPQPTITSFTVSPSTVTVGVNASFATVVGVPPGAWTYSYTGLPAGCAGATQAAFVCAPTASGTFAVNVTATDHLGAAVTAAVSLTVNANPTIAGFAAAPGAIALGASVQFSASISGGTGPVSFSYTGLPAGCDTVNSTALNCTPTVEGTFRVTLHAQDHFGHLAAATTTLVVNPPTLTSPGTPSGTSGTADWVIAFVVLVVVGIVIEVVILLRRKGQKPA